ncbi:MAG: hypothetical protein O3B24_06015 [Verrucomicrobia bacterium]|nr:hypothetical protein [Verrucomicrobiota bacterium]
MLVIWILLLMSENRALKSENTKVKNQLRDHMEKHFQQVAVIAGRKLSANEVNRITQSAERG